MGARFDRFRVATGATLRARYGRTVLGIAWLPIAPVVLVATLVLALSSIIGETGPALELVLGLILWNFFSAGSSEGLSGLASRKGLLSAAGPAAGGVMAASLVPHFLELVVALATFAICQSIVSVGPVWNAFAALLPLGGLLLLTYGVALVIASLEARLGDVQHGWRLVLAVGFWVTPVVYPAARIPEAHRWIVQGNPLGRIIEETRQPILEGTLPSAEAMGITAGVVLLIWAIGRAYFRRSLPLILERL